MNREYKNNESPPPFADRPLEWFRAPHLLEEVQGDLHELYGKWMEKHGVKKAQWLYFFHTIKFFRPLSFLDPMRLKEIKILNQ